MKESFKNTCDSVARILTDNDRINSLLKATKCTDSTLIKESMRKVKSSLINLLIPEKTNNQNHLGTGKKDIKDTEDIKNTKDAEDTKDTKAIRHTEDGYNLHDPENNAVLNDVHPDNRATNVSIDEFKKDCKNDSKADPFRLSSSTDSSSKRSSFISKLPITPKS